MGNNSNTDSPEKSYFKTVKPIMWTTWSFTGIIGGGLLYAGYNLDKVNYHLHLLLILFAIIMGWVTAFITSPYDKEDSKNLSKFSGLVGSFIGGYILSKFDKIADSIIDSNKTLEGIVGVRVLLFISFYFLSWLVVYATRQYFDDSKEKGKYVPKRKTYIIR